MEQENLDFIADDGYKYDEDPLYVPDDEDDTDDDESLSEYEEDDKVDDESLSENDEDVTDDESLSENDEDGNESGDEDPEYVTVNIPLPFIFDEAWFEKFQIMNSGLKI